MFLPFGAVVRLLLFALVVARRVAALWGGVGVGAGGGEKAPGGDGKGEPGSMTGDPDSGIGEGEACSMTGAGASMVGAVVSKTGDTLIGPAWGAFKLRDPSLRLLFKLSRKGPPVLL